MGQGGEQGAGPTRRTLMRGAAWSVPVVAVAAQAPAFAASPCDPQTYRIDWGTTAYTPPGSLTASPNVGTASASGSAGGNVLQVTFDSAVAGGATRYDSNLTVLGTTNIGGLGAAEKGLAIRTGNTSLTAAANPTVTIRFSRAVSNLSFYLVDLDRDSNFWDRVTCNPLPSSSSTRASTVAGVGDSGLEVAGSGPFRYTGGSTGIGDTSSAGNVQLVYNGGASFTQLQLIYWNAGTPGPQGILLSDFTFTARGC